MAFPMYIIAHLATVFNNKMKNLQIGIAQKIVPSGRPETYPNRLGIHSSSIDKRYIKRMTANVWHLRLRSDWHLHRKKCGGVTGKFPPLIEIAVVISMLNISLEADATLERLP